MFKKIILTGFVYGLVVLNSMAAIEGSDIIFTSEIMEKDNKMPTTFANALAMLRSEWLIKLRNFGNINYAENRIDGKSRVDATNTGRDPVTILLVKLFPSNGGVLEIFTGGISNFANEMNKLSEKKRYEIIAKLLKICQNVRCGAIVDTRIVDAQKVLKEKDDKLRTAKNELNALNRDSKKTGNDNEIKKEAAKSNLKVARKAYDDAKNELETLECVKDIPKSLKDTFKLVEQSVEFEKNAPLSLYPKYITETMILAFCCCFFNGSSGDVPKLLKAMEKVGVISHFDESDFSNRSKIEAYIQAVNQKIENTKETVYSCTFEAGENTLSLEQFLAAFCGKNGIVPYPSSALFEQNINVMLPNGNHFPDCVETAIRHFVTMMCEYDSKEDKIKVPSGFRDEVKEFFAKYNKRATTNGHMQSVHNDWANLCHNVPRARFDYNKILKTKNLSSNWKNFLEIVVYLTGNKIKVPNDRPPYLCYHGTVDIAKTLGDIVEQSGRKDAIFNFINIKSYTNDVECKISKQGEPDFNFTISIDCCHSSLRAGNIDKSPILYRLLEIENIYGDMLISYVRMPGDIQQIIQPFEDRVDVKNMIRRKYALNCIAPALTMRDSTLENFRKYFFSDFSKNVLRYLVKDVRKIEDVTESLAEQLKCLAALCEANGVPIVSLTSPGCDFDTIDGVGSLFKMQERYAENSTIGKVINEIKKIFTQAKGQFFVVRMSTECNITEDFLYFIKNNDFINLKFIDVELKDRFIFEAESKNKIFNMGEWHFAQGGTIDLTRCAEAANYKCNYTVKLDDRHNGAQIIEKKESETAQVRIELPANSCLSFYVTRKDQCPPDAVAQQ